MDKELQKHVVRVVEKFDTPEGDGVIVGRALPHRDVPLAEVDPFLLWDEARMEPGGPSFPRHPHRGFEILTYPLSGDIHHADSMGNQATVAAGGLMRITAGKGIWHEEGGGSQEAKTLWGIQFWVNLPLDEKKREPDLQTAEEKDLPVTHEPGARIKTLVGEGSPVKIVTPMVYLDVALEAGARFEKEFAGDFRGFAYVLEGAGTFGPEDDDAARGNLVVLGEGTSVFAAAGDEGLRFMLALGRPLRQPIRWRGPYVD